MKHSWNTVTFTVRRQG